MRSEKELKDKRTEKREGLKGEGQLSIIERVPELELRTEKKLHKRTERRELLKGERQLSIIERAPDIELQSQEELKVVVHAGCGNTVETRTKDKTIDRITSKRWSFCYGESDLLALLPKASQSAGSRDDACLGEAHHGRRKAWPL